MAIGDGNRRATKHALARPDPHRASGPKQNRFANDADDRGMPGNLQSSRLHDDGSVDVAMDRRFVDAARNRRPHDNRTRDDAIDGRLHMRHASCR